MTDTRAQTRRPLASDAVQALEAFRAGGARSFETLGVAGARRLYEQSCAANGLPPDDIARVQDFVVKERFAVRLYDPTAAASATDAILFLHGGGWVFGSLETHDGLCRRIAARTGTPVLAVDYRLAPEYPYPSALDDAVDALEWLTDPLAPHGLDITRVVLAGDSAGAQLVAVLTNATVHDPIGAEVSGQVLIYPVTDLTMRTASYERITERLPLVAKTMHWFADLYAPADVDRTAPELSPLRHELPWGLPSTFILTVGHDPLADEGIGYAAALARSGADVTHLHLGGYAHGLFTSAGVIPRGAEVLDEVAAFISACFAD